MNVQPSTVPAKQWILTLIMAIIISAIGIYGIFQAKPISQSSETCHPHSSKYQFTLNRLCSEYLYLKNHPDVLRMPL